MGFTAPHVCKQQVLSLHSVQNFHHQPLEVFNVLGHERYLTQIQEFGFVTEVAVLVMELGLEIGFK